MSKSLTGAGWSATMNARALRLAARAAVLLCWAALAGCGGGEPSTPTGAMPEAATAAQSKGEAQALAVAADEAAEASAIEVKGLYPVAVRRVVWPTYEYDYRIVVQNNGAAVDGVAVRLLNPPAGVQVVDGTVQVGTLAANKLVSPADTITVRKHLLNPFILRANEWQVTLGPPTLAGVAAVGAALANANVAVIDSTGAAACAQATIVTSGAGAFSCSVLAGRVAPFIISVSDPSGAYAPMVSVALAAPAAGTTLIANVTPLTTAIVGQLSPDGNALAVLANPALVDVARLAAITNNVLAQIGPVLTALGAPAGYNPFTTQIVAGSITQGGNTADQVLEALRFSSVNGQTFVATIDNPLGAVPLAGATGTATALPAPSPTALSLADSLRLIVATLRDCFALPVASRVLAEDTSIPANQGGPSVTSVAAACQELTHPSYLNNGYRFGQRYYGLLRDATMVGATFSPAEVTLFVDDTSAADNDTAIANIRYVDANGNAGNLIEVLRKLPSSATATHPSDWWAVGNQQQVESLIRTYVRRSLQLAPNPGTAPFANAGASRFEVGIEMLVNKDGPGSAGLRAARVTGPGLPPAGVVLTRPDPAIITDQFWLNIRRKDGLTDPAHATFAAAVGDIFVLQRTQGVSGTAAATVQPNPNAANANNTQFVNWAHPADYGFAPGTANFIDFTALKAQDVYTLELFYDGELAPRHTYAKRRSTAVYPATYVSNLRWLDLTPGTVGYLSPTDTLAAAQTAMTLAWIADPFAETVSSAGVYTFGGGLAVADPVVPVARGATGATAVAPAGVPFRALTSDGTSSRTIQLRYRMLDGSYKDSTVRFN